MNDRLINAPSDECIGNLQGLLTAVRLAHKEVLRVHSELRGIDSVQRVLGVDEGRGAARLLRRCNDVQSERGLSGTLGTVDLGDATAGQATDADCCIEGNGARGDDLMSSVAGSLACV